jgi:hypothetical protein
MEAKKNINNKIKYSNLIFKYIKILLVLFGENNYFITFFIELHEQKFHICTWNLYCTIHGIFIFNITQVII